MHFKTFPTDGVHQKLILDRFRGDITFESLSLQASFKGFVEDISGDSATLVVVDSANVPLAEFVVDLSSHQVRTHSPVYIVPGHPFTSKRSGEDCSRLWCWMFVPGKEIE